MPALPNPRWERFAQELANGQPATRAYVLAGYRSNSGNAATLKAQQSVSKRVKELLAHREEIEAKGIARAIERRGITRSDVLAMLLEDHHLARQKGQIAVLFGQRNCWAKSSACLSSGANSRSSSG
jgi:hypothetical protein